MAGTHVVPVLLWEGDARRSPLDARTIDEDVDVAAHRVERAREEAPDGREVGEVAVDELDGRAERLERAEGVQVLRRAAGGGRALDEADGRARFGECARARGSNASRRGAGRR
jgi:hypothetical protein